MATGQKVLDGTTKGGWYRAGDNLRQDLVTLGLPNRQPSRHPDPGPAAPAPAPAADSSPALWPRVAVGVALLVAVAVIAGIVLRRRSSPGPAPSHSPRGPPHLLTAAGRPDHRPPGGVVRPAGARRRASIHR